MFTVRKSQEISYVLLKVAVFVRRQNLRGKLEKWAAELLETASLSDFERSLKVIGVLEAFVNLGRQLYEIEPVNAEILIKELSTLKAAMRQFAGLENLQGLKDIFASKKQNSDNIHENADKTSDIEIGNAANSIIRQSAILQKMRQSGNDGLQFREILDAFPDFSERTLRYDLQKLVNHGLIDRAGSGGPGTSYMIKAGHKNNSNDFADLSL